MNTQREHLANFYIAGFTYYDAPLCFSKLKIGTHLRLKLEKIINLTQERLPFITKTLN